MGGGSANLGNFLKDPVSSLNPIGHATARAGESGRDALTGKKELKKEGKRAIAALDAAETERTNERNRLESEASAKEDAQRRASGGSSSSTLLTGGTGVDDDDLNISRRTLLGS